MSTGSRRKRSTSFSEIIAEFAAVYGVNNDGSGSDDDGSDSANARIDITTKVTEKVLALTTVEPDVLTTGEFNAQGLNILRTPKLEEIVSTYVLSTF